jgi:hypothetical protein
MSNGTQVVNPVFGNGDHNTFGSVQIDPTQNVHAGFFGGPATGTQIVDPVFGNGDHNTFGNVQIDPTQNVF